VIQSYVIWPILVLQINYDVIKFQEFQLSRHFGDVMKLRHLKYVTNIFHFQVPPLAKSWLRPGPRL